MDEFSDLNSKEKECAQILRLICGSDKASWMKMMVAGYSLNSQELQSILGEHHLLSVTGRQHTLERCQITSSGDIESVLGIATRLTTAALRRGSDYTGNVMVFLPGWREMLIVQKDLLQNFPNLIVLLLHSEMIGDDNQEQVVLSDETGPMVVLSTVIGARSVFLRVMKYVIIHPQMRCSFVHASEITRIRDCLVSQELEGNMAGRAGRESDGLVTKICMPHSASGQGHPLIDDSAQASEYMLQYLEQYWYSKH